MSDTIYQNKHYKVVLNPDEEGNNFEVISLAHDVVESRQETLPSALAVSEQMHRILEYSIWEKHAESMYPDPSNPAFNFGGMMDPDDVITFEVDGDDDDDPSIQ